MNILDLILDEVCDNCRYAVVDWNCTEKCPYQSYFDELAAKCDDIQRDTDYLIELVKGD